MRRIRHTLLMFADVIGLSRYTGAAWLVPVMVLLLLSAVAAVASQAAVPYVVYTFF